jgi:hypothetical protein
MAASFYAYTNRELNVQDSTGTKKHYVAKLDTSYNVMKSRFYLDNFVNVDGVGVVGCVTIGGANASMHNLTTRGGIGRNGNMILLNDAGLNTKGISYVLEAASKFLNAGIIYDYEANPSWYQGGLIYVRVKDVATLTWSPWIFVRSVIDGKTLGSPLVQNGAFINVFDLFPNYDVGKTYTIQLRHTNTEGDYLSDEIAVIIKPEAVGFKRGSSPSEAYNSTTVYQEYPDTNPVDIGTRIYEDQGMELPLAGGHHMLPDGTWYQLDSNGYVITKGFYTPPSATVVYDVWIQRLGISGKVGEVQVYGEIANQSGGYQTTQEVTYRVGTHNGSFGGWDWYWNGSFDAGGLQPSESRTFNDVGDIDESYALYNWGYQIYVGSTLKDEGSL